MGPAGPPTPTVEERAGTAGVRDNPLTAVEGFVLTVIAQRLLRHDPDATLLTCDEATTELEWLRLRKRYLREIAPAPWTSKRIEHLVTRIRQRLARQGVPRLVRGPGETGYDSVYRRSLVDHLIRSGVLSANDLRLLDPDEE